METVMGYVWLFSWILIPTAVALCFVAMLAGLIFVLTDFFIFASEPFSKKKNRKPIIYEHDFTDQTSPQNKPLTK